MMLKIFHRGSINLIKSLSTVEIKVFLTFREAIKKNFFVTNVTDLLRLPGDHIF